MKFYKRLNLYKASNVTFNPKTLDAFSYKWWRFVGIVEGTLIFNDFRYSVSTAKHQRKVKAVLNGLGIKPDLIMPLPRGIRHDQSLAQLIEEAETEACDQIIWQEEKKIKRNEKAKERRIKAMQERVKATIERIGPRILVDAAELFQQMKDNGMKV